MNKIMKKENCQYIVWLGGKAGGDSRKCKYPAKYKVIRSSNKKDVCFLCERHKNRTRFSPNDKVVALKT